MILDRWTKLQEGHPVSICFIPLILGVNCSFNSASRNRESFVEFCALGGIIERE